MLLWDGFAVRFEPSDVRLDGLNRTISALLDGLSTGEAPRQRRNGDEVASVSLGLYNYRVRTH